MREIEKSSNMWHERGIFKSLKKITFAVAWWESALGKRGSPGSGKGALLGTETRQKVEGRIVLDSRGGAEPARAKQGCSANGQSIAKGWGGARGVDFALSKS